MNKYHILEHLFLACFINMFTFTIFLHASFAMFKQFTEDRALEYVQMKVWRDST